MQWLEGGCVASCSWLCGNVQKQGFYFTICFEMGFPTAHTDLQLNTWQRMTSNSSFPYHHHVTLRITGVQKKA